MKATPMQNVEKLAAAPSAIVPVAQGPDRKRTVVAILSASIISLVVWVLIVALKIQ